MKISTLKVDRGILELLRGGRTPKEVYAALNLQSVQCVYGAVYRDRRRRGVKLMPGKGRPKNKKKYRKIQ